MTRKDYQSIADALVRAHFRMEAQIGNEAIAFECFKVTADSLAQQNPAFNRERFFKACGLEDS